MIDEADLADGSKGKFEGFSGDDALALFNIPANVWDCALTDCTPEALLTVENYLKNQSEFVRNGLGYFFSGPAGVGKTTAAVQLAKHGLRSWGTDKTGKPVIVNEGWYGHLTDRSIYFTRASELRDAVRFHREFGDSGLIENLMRRAKVLIIDDLDLTDFSDSFFNWKSLVLDRAATRRPTFFTSILTYIEMGEVQPTWFPQVGRVLYEVPVTGTNRRAEEIRTNRTKIFKQKGSL